MRHDVVPGVRRVGHSYVTDGGRLDLGRGSVHRPGDREDRRRGATRPATGSIVSTEFSASNGPRTAGGTFPPVDDPLDDVPGNPNHRWIRIIDADAIAPGTGWRVPTPVPTRPDTTPGRRRTTGSGPTRWCSATGAPVSAWDFRNDFDLPSPGFELIPIRRTLTAAGSFAFIGDSVGVTIADRRLRLPGDDRGRVLVVDVRLAHVAPTQGGASDGVSVAKQVPVGTDLVVVELGYNDTPSSMASADRRRDDASSGPATSAGWRGSTCPSAKSSAGYAATNAAIGATVGRWEELVVLDWKSASDDSVADRWYNVGRRPSHHQRQRRVRPVAARPSDRDAVRRLHPAGGAARLYPGVALAGAGVGVRWCSVVGGDWCCVECDGGEARLGRGGSGCGRVVRLEPETSSVNFSVGWCGGAECGGGAGRCDW